MGSDDEVAASVAQSSARAGEAAWAMPLPEELRKGLDSMVADLTNVSPDRNGGMLVAGLFLREFVPAGVSWAHLDIAGPAFNESGALPEQLLAQLYRCGHPGPGPDRRGRGGGHPARGMIGAGGLLSLVLLPGRDHAG